MFYTDCTPQFPACVETRIPTAEGQTKADNLCTAQSSLVAGKNQAKGKTEMLKATTIRSILLGTVVCLPLAATGQAQTIEINEDQLVGKSLECRQLAETVMLQEQPIEADSVNDVISAINDDSAERCDMIRTQLASADQDPMRESESLTEEVLLSEEATIEGRAVVSVPEPNVDVQVPPPNIRVTEQQPQVDITQEPAQVDIQQAQPRIAVEIPEIIVRVEIPAPRIYILQPDPQVLVSQADPQVEVEQGEPQIRVSQADPELDVNLGIEAGQADGQAEQIAGADQQESDRQQVGEVSVAGGQPQIEIVEAEGQPLMSYARGEPTLSYQNVEPEILVVMAQQPTVDVQQSGEATIVLETLDEREKRRQQASDQAQRQQQQTEQTAMGGSTMTVGDLMDMEVVTADGEELGTPEAIVEVNGEMNLVFENGGFLGIGGKEVAVRASRVSIQGEQLILSNMTEEEIEEASSFQYDENARLPEEQQVRIGG